MREARPRKIDNGLSVAVKSIAKTKLAGDVHLLKRELEILRLIDHPHVVKFYECYEDAKYLHLVMEMCSGGDILERLLAQGTFSEAQVAAIMRSLLLAVNHLHEVGIVHRDLKPENFLYVKPGADAEIKIIDFGMSNRLESAKLHSMVGTPYYLAPEMLTGSYGKECDIWSLGVVMYLLLSGRQPFNGNNIAEVFTKIRTADYDFEHSVWSSISLHAIELIKKMLTYSPGMRISIEAALQHPWFSDTAKAAPVPERVLQSLRRFRAPKKLQQEAMRVVVKYMPVESISELKTAFLELDRAKTGFITVEDLETAMTRAGFEVASEEISRTNYTGIVAAMDYLHQGRIKYSDFLAATLDRRKYVDEEVLDLAFSHFDSDSDGFITPSDLKSSLLGPDSELCEDDIDEMIAEFDYNQDARIDKDEFRAMMENLNAMSVCISSRCSSRANSRQRSMSRVVAAYG